VFYDDDADLSRLDGRTVAIVGYVLFNFGPTGQLIADRAKTPHSNQGRSILYSEAADYARTRGIIIADTKFEFGLANGQVIWIDEALTPDSSRFWPADQYRVGQGQPSFDKQYVRDWAASTGWDREPPAPAIPDEIVARTREKYVEAYERITGQPSDDWLKRTR